MFLQPPEADPGAPPICSARGCRREATWALRWNNPKLHEPDRRKVWTACDEHRETLGAFLQLRGFLRDVVPLAADRAIKDRSPERLSDDAGGSGDTLE